MIYPLATLATAVVAALAGSWLARFLVGDGMATEMGAAVSRTLMWAVIPAALSVGLAYSSFPSTLVALVAATVVGVVAATHYATRFRTARRPLAREVGATALWVTGMIAVIAAVIFVASLFGLTGA